MAGFGTQKSDEIEFKLQTQVFEALGAVSVAWDETPTGVFDSTLAKEIGDELMENIMVALRNRFVAVAELDHRRQEQLETQRKMLAISQAKFVRLLETIDHIDESGQLDDYHKLRETITADREEVATWVL